MIYKILVLERKDNVKPLYSPLMIKVTNPNQTISWEEYETENVEELEQKITELVQASGTSKIRVIADVTYELNITVPIT